MNSVCAECGGEIAGHVAFHSIECTRNGMSPIQWPRMETIEDAHTPSALNTQVAGNHYSKMKIQPVEFIHANGIPFIEGCIIKYAARWRDKGGVEDLKKIKHFVDLLIELESK